MGSLRIVKASLVSTLSLINEPIKQQCEPMVIPHFRRIIQLSVGDDFCLALDGEGTVFAWGNGEQGQVGRPFVEQGRTGRRVFEQDEIARRLVERRLLTALRLSRVAMARKKIISIYTGANHAFAIDSNGNTWGWCSNNFG